MAAHALFCSDADITIALRPAHRMRLVRPPPHFFREGFHVREDPPACDRCASGHGFLRNTVVVVCVSACILSLAFERGMEGGTESSTFEATLSLQGSRHDGRPGARSLGGQGARARKGQRQRTVALGRPAVGGWLPTSVAASLWATGASNATPSAGGISTGTTRQC